MKKLACTFCLLLLAAGYALAGDPAQTKTEILAKSQTSWNSQDLPAYPAGKPEITVLRIIIPPGTILPMHKHPFINAGYLVSGELTVVTEIGKTLRLKAGEALVEVVNTWHYGRNEGMADAVIVVFYAGTPGSELSIHK